MMLEETWSDELSPHCEPLLSSQGSSAEANCPPVIYYDYPNFEQIGMRGSKKTKGVAKHSGSVRIPHPAATTLSI